MKMRQEMKTEEGKVEEIADPSTRSVHSDGGHELTAIEGILFCRTCGHSVLSYCESSAPDLLAACEMRAEAIDQRIAGNIDQSDELFVRADIAMYAALRKAKGE